MNNLTPVIQKLIIANVAIFVLFSIFPDYKPYLLIYPFGTEYFKPFQLVTYMFLHGGIGHLLMNMLGLFFLGPYLERALGSEKFLILYLASGLLAGVAQMTLTGHPGLGASGAVYGVLIGFAVMFPNVKLMFLFIPYPIRAIYMAIGIVCYDLFFGLANINDGIGHFAHLGGALMGFILIMLWKPKINRWN